MKYDKENPPPKNNYLVIDKRNRITTGFPNGTWWEHDRFQMPMHDITYYAKINLPNDRQDPDEGYIYCPNCGRVKEDL
jgi:hypothetical protein